MIRCSLIFLLVFSILFSCSNSKSTYTGKYIILSESSIDHYIVYRVKINSPADSEKMVLLSPKNDDCNWTSKIKVGSSYNFNLTKLMYIEIEEGVTVSLSRGQSIDGIKLSDGKNYPYLIENSCNGKVKSNLD